MISRYTVWLNDVSLEEIDPSIYVADIGYSALSTNRKGTRLGSADGQYSGIKDYYDKNVITVSFLIREYNTARRQEIAQEAAVWASQGGWLKTSDRVSQMIYVAPTRLPAVNSVMQWTGALTVEFTAFDYPFWVDEHPQQVTLANGEEGAATVRGVRGAYVEAHIDATEALTSVTLTCGSTSIALSSLTIAAEGSIDIKYAPEHHILQITDGGGASLLSKRTAASSDDLIAQPGSNTLAFEASGAADCTYYIRGVYV